MWRSPRAWRHTFRTVGHPCRSTPRDQWRGREHRPRHGGMHGARPGSPEDSTAWQLLPSLSIGCVLSLVEDGAADAHELPSIEVRSKRELQEAEGFEVGE